MIRFQARLAQPAEEAGPELRARHDHQVTKGLLHLARTPIWGK